MSLAAVTATLISKITGPITSDLRTLIILMSADFITGIIIAGVFHRSAKSENGCLESKSGFKGISRKCMTLIFVAAAHRLDIAMGTSYIRTAVIAAYTLNELVSLTENAGIMGLPVPDVIKRAIDAFKNKK